MQTPSCLIDPPCVFVRTSSFHVSRRRCRTDKRLSNDARVTRGAKNPPRFRSHIQAQNRAETARMRKVLQADPEVYEDACY